jgi:hypothetical protein
MVAPHVGQLLQVLQAHLPALAERHRVQSLALFGSYVRGEQGPNSDLDALVTFSSPPTLLQFVALERHLAGLLGVQVDLVMRNALKPNIGQRILEEAVAV